MAWEWARHRSVGSCKHVLYIYKTLTEACVHDRQFHYSQPGWKVGEQSIFGGWRTRDRDSDIKKNSPCHPADLTLPQKRFWREKQTHLEHGELSSRRLVAKVQRSGRSKVNKYSQQQTHRTCIHVIISPLNIKSRHWFLLTRKLQTVFLIWLVRVISHTLPVGNKKKKILHMLHSKTFLFFSIIYPLLVGYSQQIAFWTEISFNAGSCQAVTG